MKLYPIFFFVAVWYGGECSLPRPVMIYPGLMDPGANIDQTCNYIQEAYPDSTCIFIQPDGPTCCFTALEIIVKNFCEASKPYFQLHPDGIDLIGFSIGGLIADGVIKSCDGHTFKTFINVAGPINGIFGIPQTFSITTVLGLQAFVGMPLSAVSKVQFTPTSQNTTSVSGMWNDPINIPPFLVGNAYLPKITNLIQLPDNDQRKNNYLKLCKVVLCVGQNDTTIIPRTSPLGGFYDNKAAVLVPLETQTIYINDTYGIKTIDQRGHLTRFMIPGVDHFSITNSATIQGYLLPQLLNTTCP